MAKKDFILQGFTERTHTKAILRLFDIKNVEEVILSVAFVTEDGVRLIESKLHKYANKTKVFSGIRNDITSRQGLSRLLGLGVSVYAVDTGARNIVFHPKLYLVRGSEQARLLIGSANLTLGGLNNNIEASLILDLDLDNSPDRKFVSKIENQILKLPALYNDHVFLIESEAQLLALQANGRLLDESEASPPRPTTTASAPSTDPIPRIKLKVLPLHRSSRRAKAQPAAYRRISGAPQAQKQSQVSTNLELVWQSKPLTERDLNIPKERGTHATGSINLDKGLLEDNIDHRHYFRDAVFAHLQWEPRQSGNVEETEVRFQLVIKGIYYGEFPLQIRHSTDTNSETYKQHNAMTRLSWGSIGDHVKRKDLLSRTLSLFRDETDPKRFVLEID